MKSRSSQRKAKPTKFNGSRKMKVAWSLEEDESLKQIISAHLRGNDKVPWVTISNEMAVQNSLRTAKQCRERWFNHLQPNLKKGNWTQREDTVIKSLQEEIGNQWSRIAERLEGRTDNDVKNRWYSMMRTQKRHATTLMNLKNSPPKYESEEKSSKMPISKISIAKAKRGRSKVLTAAARSGRGKTIHTIKSLKDNDGAKRDVQISIKAKYVPQNTSHDGNGHKTDSDLDLESDLPSDASDDDSDYDPDDECNYTSKRKRDSKSDYKTKPAPVPRAFNTAPVVPTENRSFISLVPGNPSDNKNMVLFSPLVRATTAKNAPNAPNASASTMTSSQTEVASAGEAQASHPKSSITQATSNFATPRPRGPGSNITPFTTIAARSINNTNSVSSSANDSTLQAFLSFQSPQLESPHPHLSDYFSTAERSGLPLGVMQDCTPDRRCANWNQQESSWDPSLNLIQLANVADLVEFADLTPVRRTVEL